MTSPTRRTVTADHLRWLRRSAALTQQQLAARLEVRTATVGSRETSSRPISWEVWLAACAAISADPESCYDRAHAEVTRAVQPGN